MKYISPHKAENANDTSTLTKKKNQQNLSLELWFPSKIQCFLEDVPLQNSSIFREKKRYIRKCGNQECMLAMRTSLGWEELSTAIMYCLSMTWVRKGSGGSGPYCRSIPALRAAISSMKRKKIQWHTASHRQHVIPLLESQCNLHYPSTLTNIPGMSQWFQECFSRDVISSVVLKQQYL